MNQTLWCGDRRLDGATLRVQAARAASGLLALGLRSGDAVAVMDSGRISHTGSMQALAEDEALQQRLLGLSLDAHQ